MYGEEPVCPVNASGEKDVLTRTAYRLKAFGGTNSIPWESHVTYCPRLSEEASRVGMKEAVRPPGHDAEYPDVEHRVGLTAQVARIILRFPNIEITSH